MLKGRSKLAFLAEITAATILVSNGVAVSVSTRPQDATVQGSEGRRVVKMHPSLAAARLTRRSEPVYPDAVQAAGISGAVLLDVTVDEHGAVEAIQPLAGYPVLLDAAAETVRHWRYLPFSQDGSAVAFKATLVVNFLLTDDDTPHLWLSEHGAIRRQGSEKTPSQKDLGRLFQKSPTAVIGHHPDISFATLENAVKELSELGLQHPQISFFTFDDSKLYYVGRNPGVPEGPEISLKDIPGASVPKDDLSASAIFQVFVSAEGQATKVLQMTGPPRAETEQALKALKLERPVMWQNEAVPATFYVQTH